MAAGVCLSTEERAFILAGIQQNLRTDGRSCNDYNYFTVRIGLISNANGSAEVKLGKSHVMVGVKAELQEVRMETPEEGIIELCVDCTANASPAFEGKGGEELAYELSSALEKIVNRTTIDLRSLCVIPGKSCWKLHVDAIVLECGGNLLDTLSLCVKAALHSTEIPDLEVNGESGEVEIEVPDEEYAVHSIDVSNVPVICTVNKIGSNLVLDVTVEEEICCEAKLLVSVDESGSICGMQKYGKGGLNPELAFEMIQTAKESGRMLNRNLMDVLQKQQSKTEMDTNQVT